MKKIVCFVITGLLVQQMCSMEEAHNLTVAMRRFRLGDSAHDLTTISRRDPDSLLCSAARQRCPHVICAMLSHATVHRWDSSIFFNTVSMGDFDLLRLLLDKHALVDVDGFEAVLYMPDSMKEGVAKEQVKRLTLSFAQELLRRISVEQKNKIIRDAVDYNKTRALYFLGKWNFLPNA